MDISASNNSKQIEKRQIGDIHAPKKAIASPCVCSAKATHVSLLKAAKFKYTDGFGHKVQS